RQSAAAAAIVAHLGAQAGLHAAGLLLVLTHSPEFLARLPHDYVTDIVRETATERLEDARLLWSAGLVGETHGDNRAPSWAPWAAITVVYTSSMWLAAIRRAAPPLPLAKGVPFALACGLVSTAAAWLSAGPLRTAAI